MDSAFLLARKEDSGLLGKSSCCNNSGCDSISFGFSGAGSKEIALNVDILKLVVSREQKWIYHLDLENVADIISSINMPDQQAFLLYILA